MKFSTAFSRSLVGGGTVPDTSPTGSVNKNDLAKIAVHALIVGATAILVVIGEQIGNIDFGPYNALIVPVISSAVIWLQKLLKNNDTGV